MDIPTILIVIATLESSCNDKAIGSFNERGRYQITRAVWYEHEYLPFEYWAHKEHEATQVATAHINQCIIPALNRHGLPITAANIYGCWMRGTVGYPEMIKGKRKMSQLVREQTIKAQKLYDSLRRVRGSYKRLQKKI